MRLQSGLMNTLIVDAEGVYDPRQLNDRLLLGLKGTISEAELGWIRQRAHEGLLAKARRGDEHLVVHEAPHALLDHAR